LIKMARGKGKHRKRDHEELEEESFKEYKKPRATDAFGNDIPSDAEVGDDDEPVEATIDFGGEQSSAVELFEMAKDQQQQGENAAVVQKLLEAALEQFEKEDKAGGVAAAGAGDVSTTTTFKYQFGLCLLELAGTVLHKPYAERAIEVFKSADASGEAGGGGGGAAAAAEKGAAATAADAEKSIAAADLFEAQAHAWLEIARIEILMDDDDDGDDGDGAGDAEEDTTEPGEAAVAKAAELHQQCIEAVAGTEGKVAKQLAFSRQLQRCAEDVKDDPDAAAALLEQAVASAKAAITMAPDDKAGLQQHGACLNSLGNVVGDEAAELQCFTDAVAQLRAAAGNSADPEAEAENMQLLSSALLQLGRRTADDDLAEKLLGEGFELLEKAAAANPANAALQNFVSQLSAQQQEGAVEEDEEGGGAAAAE